MQNHKILAAVGCLMVVAATVTDYGAGRIAIPTAHRVPVETFPLRVGFWVAGPRLAVDQGVREKLSKATILEHVYSDGRQTPVDCMLVTADTSENLHDPTMCFPAQGWRLTHERSAVVAGQPLHIMDAALEDQDMTVMYWIGGYRPPPPARTPLARALTRLRLRLRGTREGNSLFVRLMAPNTERGQQALTQFAQQIMPQIRTLTNSPGGRSARKADGKSYPENDRAEHHA